MVGKGSFKKLKSKGLLTAIVFLVGLGCCSYPLVSSIYESYLQRNAIATYVDSVGTSDDSDIRSSLQDAHKYNSMLYQTRGASIGGISEGILSDDSYNNILKVSDDGVMGSIEIPKINVNLPIYHGTSDEVLSKGVGHIQESSLPVGGENTRSVLTSHRGLPNSKLFTRLDEMEEGDLFFIRVYDETLAYKVAKIETISPEEVEKLEIEPGKDLVSLLTCTPYGINSHRLVVTGERVEYSKADHDSIDKEMMSWRELLFASLPFIFIGIVVILYIKDRKEKKSNDEVKD